MRSMRRGVMALLVSITAFFSGIAAPSDSKTLPAGTRFYLVTDQEVSSKRGQADTGMPVMCRVWRDVEVAGTVVIKGGTPANCRVDSVKRSNMGGIEGKVSIGGIETRSVDGQTVMLQGGYNKEGGGRKAAVWTAGILLLWPILFVPGGAAVLPPGTVFDVSTVNNLSMAIEGSAPRRINMAALAGSTSGEILIDEFLAQKKPENLKMKLSVPGDKVDLGAFKIDSVNGKDVEPISVTVVESTVTEGDVVAVAEVKIKALGKYFQKGINRFDVSYFGNGTREPVELILDVQM